MSSAAPVDPFRSALAGLLAAMLPNLVYYGTYEYRVLTATVEPPITIDRVATDPPVIENFPASLSRLVLWPGPDGSVAVPVVGSVVRVSFVNGDPTKPAIVGLDPITRPLLTYVGGLPGSPVSGIGDTVTITQAQLSAAGAQAGGNPLTVVGAIVATITSGSATVQRRA